MAHVEVLQRLAEHPGLRVSDLAGRQKLAINTVSNVIQQMVVAGLVDRRADQRDRRAVTLHLTDQGEQQLQAWLNGNGRRLDAAFSELPQRDRTAIVAALPALGQLVERLEGLNLPQRDLPERDLS
ncbi:MAG: Transcriptional regulator, MarR family [Frankiales bacterium]|nr:Transcriptional regulator, MarR family [Frankiales bacterium]